MYTQIWRKKSPNPPWSLSGKQPWLLCESFLSLIVSPADSGLGGREQRRNFRVFDVSRELVGSLLLLFQAGTTFPRGESSGSEMRWPREVCHLLGRGVTSWHEKWARKISPKATVIKEFILHRPRCHLVELGHVGEVLEDPGDPQNVTVSPGAQRPKSQQIEQIQFVLKKKKIKELWQN